MSENPFKVSEDVQRLKYKHSLVMSVHVVKPDNILRLAKLIEPAKTKHQLLAVCACGTL